MELFTPIHTKTAGASTPLPEDPSAWPQEILQQLYKQAPYVADYHPDVQMVQVDAERAYAIGHVEVRNSTEIPMQTAPQAAISAAGIRRVRIPIIVKEGKLYSLDLMITEGGKSVPLTAERLRSALFRPQTFDVTSRPPGDQSLVGQLYPPYRQFYGFGGGGTVDAGAGGLGSKTAMLRKVATGVGDDVLQKLAEHFSTPMGKFALAANPSLRRSLEKIASAPPPMTKKEAALLTTSLIRPTVVQITADGGTYQVKAASHKFWAPYTYTVDRGRLYRDFGHKVALAADMEGAATIVGDPVEQPAEAASSGPITSAGFYEVETLDGESVRGYVIPNSIDPDGSTVPIAVFLGEDGRVAVQPDIVGRATDPVELNLHYAHQPSGFGIFAQETENGSMAVTAPLTLNASMSGEGGVRFNGQNMLSEPVSVCLDGMVKEPTPGPEGLMLPLSFHWISLGSPEQLIAVRGVETKKTASAGDPHMAIRVSVDRAGVVALQGEPLRKIASVQLTASDAYFLLGAAGVRPKDIAEKLGEAGLTGRTTVLYAGREIVPIEESRKVAQAKKLMPPPVDTGALFKLAEVVEDPLAVDAVLSLGILTPDNITSVLNHLPPLEEALERLCDLLFAARLGLKELDVDALERGIKGMDAVICGLKEIAFVVGPQSTASVKSKQPKV